MKKLICLLAILGTYYTNAQVGINTEAPKASLDVVATSEMITMPDGIIAPNLTGVQLKAKDNSYTTNQTGAIVYVTQGLATEDRTAKTIKVDTPGYYYFDGQVWQRFYTATEKQMWFYMPSFNLNMDKVERKTVNLYQQYSNQFNKIGNSYFVSNNSDLTAVMTGSNPPYAANELDYIVTAYDEKYIDNITIDNTGLMTYDVISINPPAHAFINIVLQPKK